MSKKGKKFDVAPLTDEQKEGLAAEGVGVVEGATTEAKEVKPRLPSLYLQDEAGVQFRFTRYPLPKKALQEGATGAGSVTIDGNSIPYFVTSNSGWAADGSAIEYAYLKVGDVAGYVALAKGEAFSGKTFTLGEGEATRKNPERVAKNPEAEVTRKELAKATLAAKAAAKAEASTTETVV